MSTHPHGPRVFISAGEVSGDIVGAKLTEAIRAASPFAVVDGLGGTRMASAGAALVASADHLGSVGVSEGLAMVPSGLRILRSATRHMDSERPDVAVLVGNDVFNYALAYSLRARGIPSVALFPPQIWVWQPLVPFFARALDLVLASFPEEDRRYRQAGTETVFVGHYLADVLEPVTEPVRQAARRSLGLSECGPVVALLPGSRAHEIQRLMPALLGAADALRVQESRLQAVVALADGTLRDVGGGIQTRSGLPIRATRDSHTAMRAADVVLCCSGTATLEAALLGIPMVVVYRMSRTTFLIVRICIGLGLLPSDTIALPNLILGRAVVPEFKQRAVAPSAIAAAAAALIPDSGARRAMRAGLAEVRALVERRGTLARAASIVIEQALAGRRQAATHGMVPMSSHCRERK